MCAIAVLQGATEDDERDIIYENIVKTCMSELAGTQAVDPDEVQADE